MFQKKLECDQYTVMIGLMKVSEHLLGEDVSNMDLTLIKERLMNKLLNFNNYVRGVWNAADSANSLDSKRSISQKFTDLFGSIKSEMSERIAHNYPHCHVVPDGNKHSPSGSNTSTGSNLSFDSNKVESVSKKNSTINTIKLLNRNEFFVYSASLSFNPNIKTGADLLNPSNGGGVVYTITAKMPVNDKQRKIYVKMLLQYLGKNSVLLDVKSESGCLDSILSKTKVVKEDSPETSTVLKPIPKYFDEDYSDEDNEPKASKEPNVVNTYSFFRHSSYLFSKYATSKLVMRDDDKYVTQRLLQVKLQRNRKHY